MAALCSASSGLASLASTSRRAPLAAPIAARIAKQTPCFTSARRTGGAGCSGRVQASAATAKQARSRGAAPRRRAAAARRLHHHCLHCGTSQLSIGRRRASAPPAGRAGRQSLCPAPPAGGGTPPRPRRRPSRAGRPGDAAWAPDPRLSAAIGGRTGPPGRGCGGQSHRPPPGRRAPGAARRPPRPRWRRCIERQRRRRACRRRRRPRLVHLALQRRPPPPPAVARSLSHPILIAPHHRRRRSSPSRRSWRSRMRSS